ncbi:outer membrane beta-barrel protein [Novosphingobium colocasiae]|uniref:outer membrane beta-barrel protein n=1 Tax=Novosphingobium colocasiae TaxID=1256513 RepID=UPI0035B37766
MKKFIAASLTAAALFAVPAAAQAQAFVQAEAGVDNVSAGGESKTGFGYGVSAGYDVALSGGMFVGVQGTVADSTTKDCFGGVCLKANRDLAAVARLGTTVGGNNKLYVLGGYTNARLELTDGVVSFHENLDGFRLGAGYEMPFGKNFFAKAEYRYSNYEADFSRHAGVIALGARF